MPKATAIVDYDKCHPDQCAPDTGICPAARACKRGIMQQEEPYDAPMVFPPDMCLGCSDCGLACPLGAVRVVAR